MTISVREGLPGSGKTLSAVGEDILPALMARRRVVTNIDLNVDAISLLLGFDVAPFVEVHLDEVQYHDERGRPALRRFFSRGEDYDAAVRWRSGGDEGVGPLIVVDECHEVLRVPGYATKADETVVNFFAVHRHKGTDIVLLTQAFGAIPAQVRERCEIRFRYLKLSFLSLAGWHAKKTHLGQDKTPVRVELGRYKRQWFGLYRSVDAKVLESLPRQRNILLTPRILIGLLLIVACFWWVSQRGLYFVSRPLPTAASGDQSAAGVGGEAPGAGEPYDGPRAQAALPGLPATYQPSERLVELRDRIAVHQAEQELELLQYARPAHDELDGRSAVISGYMAMAGRVTYFVRLFGRGGPVEVVKADDLVQYGFKVTAIDRCLAYLRGDRGVYRLTCDVPVRFGKPVDPFLPGRVVTAAVEPRRSIEIGPEGFSK